MSNSVHARLDISAQSVEKQAPEERVHNWESVYRGFDLNRAMIESARCIHCPSAPCIDACPTGNDIPTALGLIEQGDVIGAAQIFRQTSTLPEMCGRLCPQERLCEGVCPVGFALRSDLHEEPPVAIGKLEAFAADQHRAKIGGFPLPLHLAEPTGRKVAVVGSGPSGLTVAEELAVRGHEVTVYDQWHEPGGTLRHGIPNFKLSQEILDQKLRHLTLLGADFVCNTRIGRDITIDELLLTHHAIYLGVGAGTDAPAGVVGETDFKGIVSATDFLVRANASSRPLLGGPSGPRPATTTSVARAEAGPRVVVIGGTDAAMDVMRAALRLGASSVTCIFEGGPDDFHGRAEEHLHAREEGVEFRFHTKVSEFVGDMIGRVTGVRCRRIGWTDAERTSRARAFGMAGSDMTVPADLVVIAVGYVPDPLLTDTTPGLVTDSAARLHVDTATGHTSRPGVFAGGDGVHGPDLVVTAMAAGRRTATAIHQYLEALPVAGPAGPAGLLGQGIPTVGKSGRAKGRRS